MHTCNCVVNYYVSLIGKILLLLDCHSGAIMSANQQNKGRASFILLLFNRYLYIQVCGNTRSEVVPLLALKKSRKANNIARGLFGKEMILPEVVLSGLVRLDKYHTPSE